MKTLIEVDRGVWAKVKEFATIRDVSLSSAVCSLLVNALTEMGYSIRKKEDQKDGVGQI